MVRPALLLFALLLCPIAAHAQQDSVHVVDLFVRAGYADLSLKAIRAERFDALAPRGSVGLGKTLPYPNGSRVLGLELRRTLLGGEIAFGFVHRSVSATGRFQDDSYQASVTSAVNHYVIYVTSGWALVRSPRLRVYAHVSPTFETTTDLITTRLGLFNVLGNWQEFTYISDRNAHGFGIELSVGVALPVVGRLSAALEAGYYSDTVLPGYRTRVAPYNGPTLQTSGMTASFLLGWRMPQ